jgi:hypothetical protein
MATTRSKAPWIAPRQGGYSARTAADPNASAASRTNAKKAVKPQPPRGRAAASTGVK